ncbi:uncharacterized protein LOC110268855 [Arachis ipaensis]|uniref:uncharacterized protein LOC110268855 n=1 Tax=Arachis ipaensis TaxID=130454 RepID=UPI000A2B426C|nr:uncharacterized protein LOC110268855 [Arachis ipaensis]XP_020971510.1 uncharacterized protein LOC110268855 [Arachis ipaensis]XP_020971512.1 uncharacterized protein LOC110268855 [Arachis ipaensis]XP_025626433.1 uncharacterized protein LOC112719911 [Arachis hypogaea]XP_025626434.1 uncharacterized protein LOC112719911 [Arachis hypogaea]QHO18441.1 uncharacterized protein DS421_11g320550 [Arachis hypogaea]
MNILFFWDSKTLLYFLNSKKTFSLPHSHIFSPNFFIKLSPDLPHGALSPRLLLSASLSCLVPCILLIPCISPRLCPSLPRRVSPTCLCASVLPCFPRLAAPCLRPSLTTPPLRPSRLVSLSRACSRGFHFRQSLGLAGCRDLGGWPWLLRFRQSPGPGSGKTTLLLVLTGKLDHSLKRDPQAHLCCWE